MRGLEVRVSGDERNERGRGGDEWMRGLEVGPKNLIHSKLAL